MAKKRIKECYLTQVRVSPKLRDECHKACDVAQESLSEYIRKAVEFRNSQVLRGDMYR